MPTIASMFSRAPGYTLSFNQPQTTSKTILAPLSRLKLLQRERRNWPVLHNLSAIILPTSFVVRLGKMTALSFSFQFFLLWTVRRDSHYQGKQVWVPISSQASAHVIMLKFS